MIKPSDILQMREMSVDECLYEESDVRELSKTTKTIS